MKMIDRIKCKISGHVPPEGIKPGFSALEVTRSMVNRKHAILLECQRCGEEHPFTEAHSDDD